MDKILNVLIYRVIDGPVQRICIEAKGPGVNERMKFGSIEAAVKELHATADMCRKFRRHDIERITYNFKPLCDAETELETSNLDTIQCLPLTPEEQDVFWEHFKSPPLPVASPASSVQ